MSRRTDRVSSLLRKELSELIQHEIRDPRLAGLVTVTAVETEPDLKTARVFISVLGDAEARRTAVAGLTSASGFLRRSLRDRVELRPIPELSFAGDASMEEGARVVALLDEVAAIGTAETQSVEQPVKTGASARRLRSKS